MSDVLATLVTEAQTKLAAIEKIDGELSKDNPTKHSVEVVLRDNVAGNDNVVALVDRIVGSLNENFGNDGVTLTGVLALLNKRVEDSFGGTRKNVLTNLLDDAQKNVSTEPMTPEKREQLLAERKAAIEGIDAIKKVYEAVNLGTNDFLESLEVPSQRRGGSGGPRGPQIRGYAFTADGVQYPTAGKLALAFKLKASDVKAAMKAAGISLEELPTVFSFDLPHGDNETTRVSAVSTVEDDDDDDDDDDVEDNS